MRSMIFVALCLSTACTLSTRMTSAYTAPEAEPPPELLQARGRLDNPGQGVVAASLDGHDETFVALVGLDSQVCGMSSASGVSTFDLHLGLDGVEVLDEEDGVIAVVDGAGVRLETLRAEGRQVDVDPREARWVEVDGLLLDAVVSGGDLLALIWTDTGCAVAPEHGEPLLLVDGCSSDARLLRGPEAVYVVDGDKVWAETASGSFELEADAFDVDPVDGRIAMARGEEVTIDGVPVGRALAAGVISLSLRGDSLILLTGDARLVLLDADTGKRVGSRSYPGSLDVERIELSPDARGAVASGPTEIRFFDVNR